MGPRVLARARRITKRRSAAAARVPYHVRPPAANEARTGRRRTAARLAEARGRQLQRHVRPPTPDGPHGPGFPDPSADRSRIEGASGAAVLMAHPGDSGPVGPMPAADRAGVSPKPDLRAPKLTGTAETSCDHGAGRSAADRCRPMPWCRCAEAGCALGRYASSRRVLGSPWTAYVHRLLDEKCPGWRDVDFHECLGRRGRNERRAGFWPA